jgi:lipopolysaccharide export LptBFGC system permease protein LptF
MLKNVIGQEPGRGMLSMKEGVFTCRLQNSGSDIYLGNRAANRSILGNLKERHALRTEEEALTKNVLALMVEAGLYSGWSGRPENGAMAGYRQASKELAGLRRNKRQASAGIHTAMGLVLSPIPLLIFGAMLGARVRFRNRASAFLGTVVFVVLVYYPVIMATKGMIESGNSHAAALPYVLDGIVLIGALIGWRRVSGGAG